jgi:hypothetical protein
LPGAALDYPLLFGQSTIHAMNAPVMSGWIKQATQQIGKTTRRVAR